MLYAEFNKRDFLSGSNRLLFAACDGVCFFRTDDLHLAGAFYQLGTNLNEGNLELLFYSEERLPDQTPASVSNHLDEVGYVYAVSNSNPAVPMPTGRTPELFQSWIESSSPETRLRSHKPRLDVVFFPKDIVKGFLDLELSRKKSSEGKNVLLNLQANTRAGVQVIHSQGVRLTESYFDYPWSTTVFPKKKKYNVYASFAMHPVFEEWRVGSRGIGVEIERTPPPTVTTTMTSMTNPHEGRSNYLPQSDWASVSYFLGIPCPPIWRIMHPPSSLNDKILDRTWSPIDLLPFLHTLFGQYAIPGFALDQAEWEKKHKEIKARKK